MDEDTGSGANPTGGFFQSFRSLVATLLGILETRLDLFSTELEEQQERLKEILLFSAMALFCASLGVIFLTLFIVVLFWETHRLLVVGAIALVYFTLAGIAALALKKKVQSKPKLFSATLAELAKDREQLRS